ncbi:extracellular solute-binding protein [Paenibacillus sp. IB182496]|uniref:Extracellular solute-binding protein n=1 Tax=Paenibacillus sabuli TaxID=2772509 RepID=A0A927BUE9_9BACL|nr:extracellular solute-binding protein [Paenibacillus sabuli]MBD2846517.1 extracellular solute-binding protein [Paenibacillus sabuli]
MNTRVKGWLPGAMVLILSACSGGGASDQPPAGKAGETEKEERVSVHFFLSSSLPYGTPTMENNKALAFLREQTGADLNFEIYEQIYEDKIRVKIASGEIPDVFEWGKVDDFLIPLIQAEAIVPFEPYIEGYANLEAQQQLYTTKYQGQIYPIPDVRNPIASQDIPLIRQDWLDRLGLDAPTTTEELYEVAKAFTDDDPDGNGTDDTYGIQIAGNNLDGTWSLKMAFGVDNQWMEEDGKVIPYFESAGYRDYLAYMQRLFREGAIDPDFAVTDHILAQNKVVVEGRAGIFMHYATRVYEFEDGLQKSNPDARLVGFEAVSGPDGDRGIRARVNEGGAYLSKDAAENPRKLEAIMKWLDFGASQAGKVFRDSGLVDVHHKAGQDGNVELNQSVFERDSPWAFLNTAPIQDTSEVYIDRSKSEESQNIVREAHAMNEPYLVYDETKTLFSEALTSVATESDQYILDREIQAIMGQIAIEKWDDVVQEWYARFNGEQIVQEIAESM